MTDHCFRVPQPANRHAVTFVLITVFLDMVGFGLIMPVLPKLIEMVGKVTIDRAAVIGGWMFAAFSLAQFVFAPLMGNLSDRFGRRPLLLLAIFGLGLDFILMALAPTLDMAVRRADHRGDLRGKLDHRVCLYRRCRRHLTTGPRAFGLMGAAFGVGFVIGPAIGGLAGRAWAARAVLGGGGRVADQLPLWLVRAAGIPVVRRTAASSSCGGPIPFGAFRVFSTYPGVSADGAGAGSVLLWTSVYPAIWTFWGIAKFGWSEAMVG
jgi:DHA1 family tetracycline resistance protein-like MFS transporter